MERRRPRAEVDAHGAEQAQGEVEKALVIARVLLDARKPAEAMVHVSHALALEPDNLSALNLLAKLCHVQGRLTDTLRLWQRIRTLAPGREGALEQLGFLHRLATDEELSRLRLIPVGQDAYAQRHSAEVELEAAFFRFRARDFKGALGTCERVAAQYRSRPALYKLAVLQKAWFQERTDDLGGARATLEKLGRERGFETDVDRLGFLARVCERLGTEDALHQALYIYDHLHAHHGRLSALPHLATLAEALGQTERAKAHQREYLRRFAQRLHLPTLADRVCALAAVYLPLDELPCQQVDPESRHAAELEVRRTKSLAARRRRRALLAFLCGERERAARLLVRLCATRWAEAMDFAYLGDARAALKDPLAPAAYLEAARRWKGVDPAVWKKVLAAGDQEELRALLSDSRRAEEVKEALLATARAERTSPRAWRELALFEELAGFDGSAHQAKAHALEAVRQERPDLGRVKVAAVYHLGSKPKGLVHEVLVARRWVGQSGGGHLADVGVLGSVAPDFSALAAGTLASAKDYVRGVWPHLAGGCDDFVYTLKVSKDDELSSGASAGLPLAVAFLSLFLGREVNPQAAFSGALVCDAQTKLVVRRVGDVTYKVKGALHRNLEMLVLPEENRPEVEAGGVPLSIATRIVRYARSLDEVVELLWGKQAWDW